MLSRDRIENNPYRILGVYAGSPVSLELNHLNRINAFSKVGQTVSFPMRCDDMLDPVVRDGDAAAAAVQTLSLAKDRVENALFWFSDSDSDWGRMLNAAVGALARGEYAMAIICYERLVSDDRMRGEFLEACTHGLMTMGRDGLSALISEQLAACGDDWYGFWLSEGLKPTGGIAGGLFEKSVLPRLETLLESIVPVHSDGTLLSGKSVHNIDFYQSIDRLESALDEIGRLLAKARQVYGTGSIRYKELAEKACRKAYGRGAWLVTRIGWFVWEQGPKERPSGDGGYLTYTSMLPRGTVRACMDLMARVDAAVRRTVEGLQLASDSQKILYGDADAYRSVLEREFVDDDDTISGSVSVVNMKRAVYVAAWLAFLYFIFG